jgi:glycogen debranching enzyme
VILTNDLILRARGVLAANDRGGYTVPTDRLYPFQWNWDSAFVAMGFATFDLERAISELESLVKGQWADGMIPHIIFHKPAETYFPGPEVWRTNHSIQTSGITQPPVFALALRVLNLHARPEHAERIAALYRAGLNLHRWWDKARDPEGSGLVAILHNWESGRDNSPEWDKPFARVPRTTTTTIVRRDLGHVDATMRPRNEDYERYIHLVDLYASLNWEPAAMWRHTPFKIADIGTNAILTAAEAALLELASQYGTPGEATEIAERLTRRQNALATLWDDESGHFLSRDLITDQPIRVLTSAGFLPLLSDAIQAWQVEALCARLHALDQRDIMLVPSTLPDEPGFEPKRYWRGPVWAVVNWAIARGFEMRGRYDQARLIKRHLAQGFATTGFSEYFDPLTREGLGGGCFSWTAAIALLLAESEGQEPQHREAL